MFTEHGLNAFIKFFLIALLANGLDVLFNWWLGWEVKSYIYAFFLLMYMVHHERHELEKKQQPRYNITNVRRN